MAANFDMRYNIISPIVGQIAEESCKRWYKRQIWHSGSQWHTNLPIDCLKIQDGSHFSRWLPKPLRPTVFFIEMHILGRFERYWCQTYVFRHAEFNSDHCKCLWSIFRPVLAILWSAVNSLKNVSQMADISIILFNLWIYLCNFDDIDTVTYN